MGEGLVDGWGRGNFSLPLAVLVVSFFLIQVVITWQGILFFDRYCYFYICTFCASIFLLCFDFDLYLTAVCPLLYWFCFIDPILLWVSWDLLNVILLEGSEIKAVLAPANVGCDQTSCSRGNPNLFFLVNQRLISLPHSNLLTCKHCVPLIGLPSACRNDFPRARW